MKYDPVKLKQESERLSAEIVSLVGQKEQLEREIAAEKTNFELAKQAVEHERAQIAELWENATAGLRALDTEKETLRKEISLSQTELHLLESKLKTISNIVIDTVRRVEKENAREVPNSFAVKVKEVKQFIEDLTKRKNEIEVSVDKLKSQQDKLTEGVALLKSQKETFEGRLELLNKEIAENEAQHEKLMADKRNMSSEIDEIKRREQDSRVLANRLTVEYQTAYNKFKRGLRNKKIQ